LSTAQLIALGTTSEGAGLISPELWSKAGIYLDLNTGAVFGESNARQIKPLYTGLILRRPELISAFHVKPIAFDDARPIAIESNANPIGKAALPDRTQVRST
jgi:hypothetical protein